MMEESRRLVVGLEGPELSPAERNRYRAAPPLGFILLPENLVSARQAVALIAELKSLSDPPALLFVDQEGGPVDRVGPLLLDGGKFPAPGLLSEKGSDRVHENAFLMGRAARMLGFDVDLAPALDLGQPEAGAVILKDRTFGFHAEDVILAGMMFLHGLARAGLLACVKHFPGLGRGPVDSHRALPVIDAHDVDLMVTDVAPFTKLARLAAAVMVGHGAYPLMTEGLETPASTTAEIYRILRGPVGFAGVALTDDLTMGALEGPLAARAVRASEAGADAILIKTPGDEYESVAMALREEAPASGQVWERLVKLAEQSREWRGEDWSAERWERLAGDVRTFMAELERKRQPEPFEDWPE